MKRAHVARSHCAGIVIADDNVFARKSLRSMLGELPGISIVGEACSGTEMIDLCLQVRPQVALIDIRMPDMDGIAVTRVLARALPDTKIIIMSMMAEPLLLIEALRAGTCGYLLKDLSLDELGVALDTVLGGGTYLNPELATTTLRYLLATVASTPVHSQCLGSLT
ncbi:MAG: hypothetical protein RLZZ387_3398 [Chloroflexota bacterium]|jgi:DNA-binding NarL/FixJ family response regulator